MRKGLFYPILATLAISSVLIAGCTPDDNEEQNPADLKPLSLSVPVTDNWVFEKRPSITIHIENPNKVSIDANAIVKIATDMEVPVATLEKSVKVPANGSIDIPFTTDQDLDPSIYNADCKVNKKTARNFYFGVSPLDIVSAPDKQADFDRFWDTAKGQLPVLDETTVTLTEVTKKSNSSCKVYLVEMQSAPDGLDGEPVIVRGYYLEPQDGKKHPVLIHFYGYDTLNNPGKLDCPSGYGEFAEFYLSHRGQYINHRPASKRSDGIDRDFENIYGDWFTFNFGDKDGYYYRGAFMDCVQAVRFMATRTTSDMNNLFAEGSSQGGALCYAAAALSDYPFTAISPNVAFLGDFPDYFKVAYWPGNEAKKKQGTMTDEEMYAFLSYFDTKNLATRISCAVYATSGLQDRTCPPHTNIAPYKNLLSTDKEMHFYAEMTHDYPANWFNTIMKYFKDRIK
ncbi:MAG: acetylxylan esterase [Bacteroidales bacterium]|nr:acetylxylan esterase [Bacteroidales bacterium]